MQNETPELLAKGKFADLVGLSPGRITQLISSGQISADALVGEGRSAKINVARAKADLQQTLDISQRLGNGSSTKIEIPIDQDQPDMLPSYEVEPASRPSTVAEQYAKEKLETARYNNRRMKAQELESRGLYTLTNEVEVALAQSLNGMMKTFEGALVEMSNDLAEKFGLPNRDLIHAMRASYNRHRKSVSDQETLKFQDIPKTKLDSTTIEGLHEDAEGEA